MLRAWELVQRNIVEQCAKSLGAGTGPWSPAAAEARECNTSLLISSQVVTLVIIKEILSIVYALPFDSIFVTLPLICVLDTRSSLQSTLSKNKPNCIV